MFAIGSVMCYLYFVKHETFKPGMKRRKDTGRVLKHPSSSQCVNVDKSWTWMGGCDSPTSARWDLREGALRNTQTGACLTGSGAMGACVPGTWKRNMDGLWTENTKCLVSKDGRPGVSRCSEGRYDRWFL